MSSTCPRCHNEFTCLPADINACPCRQVVISDSLNMFLKKTHYTCLCPNCLHKLQGLVHQAVIERNAVQTEQREGLHYYIEKGQFIFTEYAHIVRGTCCESGCRHCAYGYARAEGSVDN